MNVLQAFIGVISMQHATTTKGVTPALAILDTQAMDYPVQVCVDIYQEHIELLGKTVFHRLDGTSYKHYQIILLLPSPRKI